MVWIVLLGVLVLWVVVGVVVAAGIVALAVAAAAAAVYGVVWLVRAWRAPELPPHVQARLREIRETNERADLSRRRQRRGYRTNFGRRR